MNGISHLDPDYSDYVEVDPTGRYGRYNEILGKGASKTVYRAFDEYDGIEVAWNQVKLYDFLQSPEDLERLYCEIHLLKTLKHENIMKFYTSWVDTSKRNINFVTEMFTSGTLRQFRLKHKRVNIRAVKHWCRQILKGLLYLHSHDPPVIHRDLKCDNIFVNGNQGEVKIGDLGLAAILRKSHAAHCVGTPEFMAPEVYKEEYNELVDIYSFGMCILEMVTFEYPYSECTHPAQIYKKVVSGKKPDALYKVKDPAIRQFVEKCLATASLRLSARELLEDPFLHDDWGSDLRTIECERDFNDMTPVINLPLLVYKECKSYYDNGYSNGDSCFEVQNGWDYHPNEAESSGIELFEYHEDEHSLNVDISIKGKRREDDGIFLRLRIADKDGRIRNIYFPFDIETDTALSVATEMVGELDITDQDVTKIADMIDGEIVSLVPEWNSGPGLEEIPRFTNLNFCQNCVSNHTSCGSIIDYLSNNPGAMIFQCSGNGCAATYGRFEEITYQVDSSDVTEGVPIESNHLEEGLHYNEIWDQHESAELSSLGSGESHSHEEHQNLDQTMSAKDESKIDNENKTAHDARDLMGGLSESPSFKAISSLPCAIVDNCENQIQQELRWIKAKYQMEIRELRDQQLIGLESKSSSCTPGSGTKEHKTINNELLSFLDSNSFQGEDNGTLLKSPSNGNNHFSSNCSNGYVKKSFPDLETQRAWICEAIKETNHKAESNMVTGKSFYTGSLLPHSLHRTTSLPVDAVNI